MKDIKYLQSKLKPKDNQEFHPDYLLLLVRRFMINFHQYDHLPPHPEAKKDSGFQKIKRNVNPEKLLNFLRR